ncbi:glycosyltransferase family 4 protein [Microbacterium dauci]|uniref:Glycosyltransferase family 4 protein n=1 Tax=Microbacterium dauci TaxID=3048008 RepID=A0ABT6ZEC2_9MICO|nr:glycosyltransferase family 4 protein [Microbacterium sp. LX3-4]MDJ1114498.1 glycosyltransferase family 4 protein [Microbacterium sp. LX3-4]
MKSSVRVLVEPVDPRRPKPGGVDTCIRGLVKFRDPAIDLRIVGVDAIGDAELGVWRREEIDGRSVWFLPVYRSDNTVMRPRVPHVAQLVAGLLRYRRRLTELGPITLQTHRVTTGFALRRFIRATSHIQFIHNDGEDSISLGNESYFKRARGAFRRLERDAVRSCRDVVVFNGPAAKRLSEWGGHVRFSPTWFDDEYFFPGDEVTTPRRRLLWVGRFEATKDPMLAVRAMALLDDDYRLTMLGGGALIDEARSLAAELGIEDRIDIVGPVAKHEVAEHLRGNELLLMTSHHEGFPRAVVEALASGLPVVTTAGGEPNGLVVDGENGTRIAERTPESVAAAIRAAETLQTEAATGSVSGLRATRLVPFVLDPDSTDTPW